jgi:hypothetical protein
VENTKLLKNTGHFMEQPKNSPKRFRPLLRASIWGAVIFIGSSLAHTIANQMWLGPLLGLAFIVSAPTFIFETIVGMPHNTYPGSLILGTVVNGSLGAVVFAGAALLWRVFAKTGF